MQRCVHGGAFSCAAWVCLVSKCFTGSKVLDQGLEGLEQSWDTVFSSLAYFSELQLSESICVCVQFAASVQFGASQQSWDAQGCPHHCFPIVSLYFFTDISEFLSTICETTVLEPAAVFVVWAYTLIRKGKSITVVPTMKWGWGPAGNFNVYM